MVDFGRIVAGVGTLGLSEALRPKKGWGATLSGKNDYQATPVDINAGAFQDPRLASNLQLLNEQRLATAGRQAPTMQAAQLGPMQGYDAAQIGQMQGASAQLGGVQGTLGQQGQLAQMLFERSQGLGGPSVAEQQLQRGLQGNIAGQMAMAGSQAGGVNPALAGRQLQAGIAGANLDTAGQASMLRAQEQMQAQQALGNILAQQGQLGLGGSELGLRGGMFTAEQANQAALQQALFQQQARQFGAQAQNIGTLQQGEFAQQAAGANQGAALQNQAQIDQMTQYFMSQGLNINEANRQAQMQLAGAQANAAAQAQALNAGIAGSNAAGMQRLFGGIAGAGGAALGMFAGGPAGAAAGSTLGSMAGGQGGTQPLGQWRLQYPSFGGQ